MKRLIYLAICFAFFKINIFSVKIASVRISFFEILVYAIGIVFISDIFKNGFKIAKQSKYSIMFFCIWIFTGILSYFWSYDKVEWLKHVRSIFTATLFLLECNTYIKNIEDVLQILNVTRMMCIIHNIIGLVEVTTGRYYFHTNVDYITKYQIYNYPVSVFYNVNNYVVFILISFILSLSLFYYKNSKKSRFLSIVLLLSSLFLIYVSGSRAVNIALIIAIVFYILFLSNLKKKIRFIFSFIGIILLFIITNIDKIYLYLNKIFSVNLQSTSGSDFIRKNILLNCFDFLKKTYGVGIGPGNFSYWIENFSKYDTLGIVQVHNWWIEILTTYGVILFILLCIFYFKLFRDFFCKFSKAAKNTDINNNILKFSILSLICFSIACISPGSLMNAEWVWVYLVTMIMVQKNCLY